MAYIDKASGDRTVSVGRIFTRSIDVLRANPVATFGTSFVLTALPAVLIPMAGYGIPLSTQSGFRAMAGMTVILGLASTVLWLVTYGALTQAAVAHGEGRKAGIDEMLRTGVLRALPLLVVYLLYVLAISLGFALLIVPGVILAVMWSLASPAIVAERPGIFGAFARSRALTKGARWKILGALLIALILYTLVVGTISVVLVAGGGSFAALTGGQTIATPSVGGQIVSTIINTVMVTWLTVFGGALFVEVRDWKDGPGTDRLADIFA